MTGILAGVQVLKRFQDAGRVKKDRYDKDQIPFAAEESFAGGFGVSARREKTVLA